MANRFIFNVTPSILEYQALANCIFGIASTLEAYAYIISGAVNGMFLPKVSKILAKKRRPARITTYDKVGRIQYSIIGLIFISFTLVGKVYLSLDGRRL